MNEMLDIEQSTCGSPMQLGVDRDALSLDLRDAPTRSVSDQVKLQSADWERWIVQILKLTENAGQEDCDGILWPSIRSIDKAYQIIDQLRSLPSDAEPTSIVPSGDGGIVFSRRTSDHREEIEISDTGHTEFLLFADGHLIDRKAW